MSSIIRADQWQNSLGVAYNSVLQVVSTTKTDIFTGSVANQGAEVDITGLSVSITPRFSNSRIFVIANVNGAMLATGLANQPAFAYRIYRGSTSIIQGDAAGSRTRVAAHAGHTAAVAGMANVTSTFFDTPNTTSTLVYKVTFVNASFTNSTGVFYLNYASAFDSDAAQVPRTASSITVMEIAQ
jgi:hypothetical protein